jgi:hypothetical protein
VITSVCSILLVAAVLSVLLLFLGCAKKDIVLADKDAPLFVSDASFSNLRVSAWDEEAGTLIDLGWFPSSHFVGRTISCFDWEAYASRVRVIVSQYEVDGQIDLDLLKKTLAALPKDKTIVIDPPSAYEREKFLAVCKRLRPDLQFQIQ